MRSDRRILLQRIFTRRRSLFAFCQTGKVDNKYTLLLSFGNSRIIAIIHYPPLFTPHFRRNAELKLEEIIYGIRGIRLNLHTGELHDNQKSELMGSLTY